MSKICELRVRPVERYFLTEFRKENADSGDICSSGAVAEFQTVHEAMRVANSLALKEIGDGVSAEVVNMVDADAGKFVIVRAHDYEPETVAYYAYSKKAAKELKAKLETDTGREFKIYRQEGVGK